MSLFEEPRLRHHPDRRHRPLAPVRVRSIGFRRGQGPGSLGAVPADGRARRPHHRGARRQRPDRHRRLGSPRPRRARAGEGRARRRRGAVQAAVAGRSRRPTSRGGHRLRRPGRHPRWRCSTARSSTTAPWSPPSAPGSSPATRAWATWCCPRSTLPGCSTSTPRYWVSCPAARSGCHCPTDSDPIRVRFLGINERHHSLAIAPATHTSATRA